MSKQETAIKDQREFFGILAEFFLRATGCAATDFATIDTFGDKIKANAPLLARRAPNAYAFASESLAAFYREHELDLFDEARRIEGLKLVLGGSSRFGQSQLDAVRKMLLYADTILIPDPILPWMEVARGEERFRIIWLLQTAFTLLHLKPLVDTDLPYPPIVLFPSYEKSLEQRDDATQSGIRQLAAGILSPYFNITFGDGDELERYVQSNQTEFMNVVGNHNLFVAPGGTLGQPLSEALLMYKDEIRRWRSEEYQSRIAKWPDSVLLLVGLLERIAPEYHLMENAQELGASPLTSLPVHWHYYLLTVRYFEQRLKALGLIDDQTISTIRAINQPEFAWLGEGSTMSNNVAEYAGVLQVLKYLAPRLPGRVTIHGDSKLVINQLNGKWRIRNGLYRSIAVEAKELLAYLKGLGWQITCCWIPRTQNEECDALSKRTGDKPDSIHQKVPKRRDSRDALMLGRTIKTTGVTVLRAEPSRGKDWWVCRCPCGREFVAHGWNVRHGRTRNCGSDEHTAQPRPILQIDMACEPGRQAMAD